MVNVFDVSDYILSKTGKITTMKLQKLVYYSQAWSLVWDEKPLFSNEIQAWANGPVCPDLFNAHRGNFYISEEDNGDKNELSNEQKDTIDSVLEFYGKKSAMWLSALTHKETPWKEARGNLKEGEHCNNPITIGSMADYYGNI